MRTMADALIATNIPVGRFDLVAGYVDGRAWTQDDWNRFLGSSLLIGISAVGTNAGTINDMERGNMTAQQVGQAGGWLDERRAAGVDPTVYCLPGYRSGYGQQDLIDILDARGVEHPWWWIADATGAPHMATGPRIVATQWRVDEQSHLGYDESMVLDFWPGVDNARPTFKEQPMIILTTANQPALFVWGNGAVGIPDQATEQALMAAGVQVASVTDTFFAAVLRQANAGGAAAGAPGPITWTPSGTITLTPSS